MCGLFGYSGKNPADITNIKLLGAYNQDRGTDSCGYATIDGVIHGVNDEKEWMKFLIKNEISLAEKSNSIVCHTRKSTMGLKNKDNAHPFMITTDMTKKGKVVGDYKVYGAHNGAIKNWKKLCEARGVKTSVIDVDSRGFYTCLAVDLFKGKYEIFEQYEGVGAFIWLSELNPDTLFVFRGESPYSNYLDVVEEERPLFYYEHNEGVYFSSTWESLCAIGGNNETVKEVPANIVFCVKDGKLTEVAKTERGTKGFQTFYEHKANNRMGPAAYSTKEKVEVDDSRRNYYDTEKSESSTRNIDAGESSKFSVNTGNSMYITAKLEKYTRILDNNINLKNDILPKARRAKGGVYFEKGRFRRTDHIYNKPTDKVLVAEDGSIITDKKKIKNSATYVVMNHNGVQKNFTHCKFYHGVMLTHNHTLNAGVNVCKQNGSLFPTSELDDYSNPDFWVRGELATGKYIYPGSTKEYGFFEGKLMYIIDHDNSNITHRREVLFSYPEGKKSEALKNTKKNIHILDLLKNSYEGVSDRAILDPSTFQIWEPLLIDGDNNLMWINTAWLQIVDDNILDHFFALVGMTKFDWHLTKAQYEAAKGMTTICTAKEFKTYSIKQCAEPLYKKNLDYVKEIAKKVGASVNHKAVYVPDMSMTSLNVLLAISGLSPRNKEIKRIPFMTFITVYNPVSPDATVVNDPIMGMKPYDIVDFSSGVVWRPSVVQKGSENVHTFIFTAIGYLDGEGFTRPVVGSGTMKLNLRAYRKDVLDNTSFTDLCKKNVAYETFINGKERFYDYCKKIGYDIFNLLDMEDFISNGYIYTRLAELLGLTGKEKAINATIGDGKKVAVDAEGSYPDVEDDEDEDDSILKNELEMQDYFEAGLAEQSMKKIVLDTFDATHKVLDKAQHLLEFLGDEGNEDYATLCEVEHIIRNNTNYFGEEGDVIEGDTEDTEIINEIFELVGSSDVMVQKDTKGNYKILPTTNYPLQLDEKRKRGMDVFMGYHADLVKEDDWYPDGFIRRKLGIKYFCVAKWYMIINIKEGSIDSTSFSISTIPEKEWINFGALQESELWTLLMELDETWKNNKLTKKV